MGLKTQIIIVGSAVVLLGNPAAAQTSFTSTWQYNWHPRPALREQRESTSVRLYTEDGRTYWFRDGYCEFEVQYPFQGSASERSVIQSIVAELEDADVDVELSARLINGRPLRLMSGEGRSACAIPNLLRGIAVGMMTTNRGKVPMILEFNRTTYDGPGGPEVELWPPWHTIYLMRQDLLTPGQKRAAWRTAGAFGLELLRAWFTRDSN